MVLRKDPLSLEGRRHRGPELLGETDESGPRTLRTPSEIECRTPALGQHPGGPLDESGIGNGLPGNRGLPLKTGNFIGQHHQFGGNLDGDGPGAPFAGDHERPPHRRVDLHGLPNREDFLGHGPEHGRLIDRMQLVGRTGIPPDTAGENDHRNVVHQRFGNSGQGVGRTGARYQRQDSDLTGRPGGPVGHERRAALVGDQHRANRRTLGQGVP